MNIYNYTREKLSNLFLEAGFKKFNSDQVFDWLYKKKTINFDDMSNLSKKLIEYLKNNFNNTYISIEKTESGKDVSKFLFKLTDNNYIEAVLMKQKYGNSLCISSQVGCNMACSFCESGRNKKIRNLDVYEMLQQIIIIERELNIRITNVVVMGIGEPFDNYDNIIDLIRILIDAKGMEIAQRKITVSTCGLVPKIRKFTEEKTQVNLAISLHASNDELRNKLMPINKAYPIKELVKEIDNYIKTTNRKVTIEYIMLDGINDTKQHALELARLFKNKLVYINLIPYNETSHFEYKRSKSKQIYDFYDILKKNNISVVERREFGNEVSAACGQLRSRQSEV